MATLIADTACVDPRAELGDEVEVGPYCVVGPGVRLGRGSRLIAHACLLGPVSLGERNVIGPFVVIGADPKGPDEPGRVEVGDNTVFRESASVERGTARGVTRIGGRVTLMPGVRVGHDAHVGDGASLGAGVVLHPRATVGDMAYVGGPTRVVHDVPPFLMFDGQPTKVRGINAVALKRAGTAKATVLALHEAYRLLFRAKITPDHAAEVLESRGHLAPEVVRLLTAIREQAEGRHGRARDRGNES